MVGMPITPSFEAHSGCSSVLTFATNNSPSCSLAIFSKSGATIRQGAHHGAQKSTKTGMSDCRTAFSKAASVTWMGSFVISLSGFKIDHPVILPRLVVLQEASAPKASTMALVYNRSVIGFMCSRR